MFDEPQNPYAVPMAAGGRVPPGGPPAAAVAAGTPPNPPRRHTADNSVPRRPLPLLLARWVADVASLQLSLGRRAAQALVKSLQTGQPHHPDRVER